VIAAAHRLIAALIAARALVAVDIATVAVNDYTGFSWRSEPVSWDIALPQPQPIAAIGLKETPRFQVEVLEGTAVAATRVRVWTVVDFAAAGQQVFTITDQPAKAAVSDLVFEPAGEKGGLALAVIGNAGIRAMVPVGGKDFAVPVSGFGLPGPVVAVATAAKDARFIGDSWLDCMPRVARVSAEIERGAIYVQSRLTYHCEGGKRYTVRVRVYAGDRPFVELVEDCALGGAARFVFSYGDWQASRFLMTRDGGFKSQPQRIAEHANPCGDFITEEGQTCLARLVVWSQFGYFAGKNETIGLFADDDSLFIGGFYIRPDRWTRAKVNHVDLYVRPEVPGKPVTRGVAGLNGAAPRAAMEAWLVDGHREWAIVAMPPRDRAAEAKALEKGRAERLKRIESTKTNKGKVPLTADQVSVEVKRIEDELATLEATTYVYPQFLPKAHVQVGIWNLDRLNRLPLVWNADGSPVTLAAQKPRGALSQAGLIGSMLTGVEGRAGLAQFNGSNGLMRGGMIADGKKYLAWARANAAVKAADIEVSDKMAGIALAAYLGMDESTYPGRRAMLPWTDPEALNPFYQGMENMNFNADRYASVAALGAGLKAAGHPQGALILDHGREQLDLALDRYVYPQSGCWEESHGYCAHTMKNATTLARILRDMGAKDFFNDVRFARMFAFWTIAHSPRDPGFGGRRIAPPIGDHGLTVDAFSAQISEVVKDFAAAKDPEIQRIARNLAWLLQEKQAALPDGVTPESPDLSSRYLQGYGVAMRASDAKARESYLVVRAEQSWGHHHMDKGSLWFWGRNVHFFGDSSWGGPPGETYGNAYKQGPASGTQIEFVGITNWTLPCKYPAPWIAEDAYHADFDYCQARCMYPFNPSIDLAKSTAVALRNGYDRQVLFVKPDLLVVRDSVESTVPTIWRLHSFQVDGTTVQGGRATLASPQGVIGELALLHPAAATLVRVDRDDLNQDKAGHPLRLPFGRKVGESDAKGAPAAYDTRSLVLRYDLPLNTSALWTFGVHDQAEPAPVVERLDADGRVCRAVLADGREVIALIARDPFTWEGRGIRFAGRVGLVIRAGGTVTLHAIRAETLTAE